MIKKDLFKLNRLKNYLIKLEVELAVLENDLISTKKNIDFLSKTIIDLSDNIKLLKKSTTIAIASEYKLSRNQLKIAEKNIQTHQVLEKGIVSKYNHNVSLHKKYMEEFKDLEKSMKEHKVILLFDPKKRKIKK